MQAKEFKYYLRKRLTPTSYVYYFINSLGSVTTTGTKTEITYAPAGWMDSAIKWERGFEWWGVFAEMSLPLKFVRDGKEIIRYVYYTEGVLGNCNLLIERLDRATGTYSEYFSGDLDFTKINNTEATYSEIPIMNGDYLGKLRSREDTEYQFDLSTHPDMFYILYDGVRLQNEINWLVSPEVNTFNNGASTIPMDRYFEESRIGIENFSFRVDGISYSAAGYANSIPAAHINNQVQQMEVNIDWDFDFTLYPLPSLNYSISNYSIVIVHTNSAGITQGTYLAYPATAFTTISSIVQNCNGSTSFTLSSGDRLYLISNITGSQAYNIVFGGNGFYNVSTNFRLNETYIPAIRPKDLFDDLINEISEGTVTTASTPLTANFASNGGADFVLTSGDGMRSLPNSKIKTTFNDFFKAYNSILNLATYYDKALAVHHIEDKVDVFNSAVTSFTIDNANNVLFKPLTERLFNGIEVGYQEINIEGLNAREAFNSKFEFSTPIERVKNNIDLICPYISDPFTMEIHRANLEGKNTTDSEEDNEVFLLHIESLPSGTYLGKDYYELYRNPSYVITGLSYPDEMYNIELTPKRNLLRNGSLLKSLLHLMDSDYIKFQTSDRNQDLVTTLGAITITESADELIGDLPSALFLPIIAEIDCPVPIDIQSILDNNPYGKIVFDYNGNNVEGFLIEASEDPATRASQKLKLLLTTNNTLTNLI